MKAYPIGPYGLKAQQAPGTELNMVMRYIFVIGMNRSAFTELWSYPSKLQN